MFDDVFDPIDQDDAAEDESVWFREATNSLRDFLSSIGKSEFTASEFRRWASYYCNLEDPGEYQPWGRVFNAAKMRGMIRVAGRARNKNGSLASGKGNRWMAA